MKTGSRIEIILLFVVLLIIVALARSHHAAAPNAGRRTNQQLESCLRLADYVGKSKVYSCQKTAELSATVSMSYANSFISCIEQMDRIITISRHACHKKYQNPSPDVMR